MMNSQRPVAFLGTVGKSLHVRAKIKAPVGEPGPLGVTALGLWGMRSRLNNHAPYNSVPPPLIYFARQALGLQHDLKRATPMFAGFSPRAQACGVFSTAAVKAV